MRHTKGERETEGKTSGVETVGEEERLSNNLTELRSKRRWSHVGLSSF